MGIIIAIVIAFSAIWVYYDATKHKIGRIKGQGGMLNMSAGAWASLTLIIGIVALPLYLIKRKALIEKTALSPVEPKWRGFKMSVLAFFGGLWILVSVSASMGSTLPSCDSGVVVDVAKTILEDDAYLKHQGLSVDGVSMVGEVNFQRGSQTRTCRARLDHARGGEFFHYTVEWYDSKRDGIFVRVLDE